MPLPVVYFWNKAPFVRLLLALVAGILVQWQFQFRPLLMSIALAVGLIVLITWFFVPLRLRFTNYYVSGMAVNLAVSAMGALLVYSNDIRHDKDWFGNQYHNGGFVVATIREPLVEKTKSFKAEASVDFLYDGRKFVPTRGTIIIYFKKEEITGAGYGSQIVFRKSLQAIRNSGNPGSFDYRRYCLFQGITHQVYLTAKDYRLSPWRHANYFKELLIGWRQQAVKIIQRFIKGSKEQGLAEALLIGYKDDLDKNLVQSYTNTGVVHIIAISGMHLSLIYWLLVVLIRPVGNKKSLRWWRYVYVLTGLWLFTFLAGAQASVVRAAVMFTCIAAGEALERQSSIYNTLALSAFLLLCIDPFWLWDVGFQLSYAAVAGIVIFFRPVYNWAYFPNKSLDFIWKTMAVSVAAQIFTTPVSLFHFHQFPVLFLLTNVVAVPLSGVILYAEIFLFAICWFAPVAGLTGMLLEKIIFLMNRHIERMDSVSLAVWNGFSLSVPQTLLMVIMSAAFCYWLLERTRTALWLWLCALLGFTVLRSQSFARAYHQKKLIVYNVPGYSAIDLVAGRSYNFIGDTALLYDDFTRNFHIQPSRILHRISPVESIPVDAKQLQFCGKKIVVIDSDIHFPRETGPQQIDIVILSKNPRLYISDLAQCVVVKQIVIDGSVPAWKAKLWKRDCDSLGIAHYDVSEKGAFVMNL